MRVHDPELYELERLVKDALAAGGKPAAADAPQTIQLSAMAAGAAAQPPSA